VTELVQTPPPARCRWPIGRLISAVVAIGMLVLAAWSFGEYRRLKAEYDAAEAAEMGAVDVDLSKPGHSVVAVSNRFLRAHGIRLVLRVEPPSGQATTAAELLGGLNATVTWIDSESQEFGQKTVINPSDLRLDGTEINLDAFGGGPSEFRFDLNVEKGAPKLAGLRQRLYAKNGLCGLESLPHTIGAFLAVGATLIAVVLLLAIGFVSLRRRKTAS